MGLLLEWNEMKKCMWKLFAAYKMLYRCKLL